MTSAQPMEHHAADGEDTAAGGLSDNDGFLVPSPIPTRRTRTYSQYVWLIQMIVPVSMQSF